MIVQQFVYGSYPDVAGHRVARSSDGITKSQTSWIESVFQAKFIGAKNKIIGDGIGFVFTKLKNEENSYVVAVYDFSGVDKFNRENGIRLHGIVIYESQLKAVGYNPTIFHEILNIDFSKKLQDQPLSTLEFEIHKVRELTVPLIELQIGIYNVIHDFINQQEILFSHNDFIDSLEVILPFMPIEHRATCFYSSNLTQENSSSNFKLLASENGLVLSNYNPRRISVNEANNYLYPKLQLQESSEDITSNPAKANEKKSCSQDDLIVEMVDTEPIGKSKKDSCPQENTNSFKITVLLVLILILEIVFLYKMKL